MLTLLEILQRANPTNLALKVQNTTLTNDDIVHLATHKKTHNRIALICHKNTSSIMTILSAFFQQTSLLLLDPTITNEEIIDVLKRVPCEKIVGRNADDFAPYLQPANPSEDILFMTSGTTDKQKIVAMSKEALVSSALCGNTMLPLQKEDRMLHVLSLAHVFGFVSVLWGLISGALVCIGEGKWNLEKEIRMFHPTCMPLFPSILTNMLYNDLIQKELRTVVVGGADCRKSVLEEVKKKGVDVRIGYGLSECIAVALSGKDSFESLQICKGTSVKIASDNEIFIHSDTFMMQGYYGMKREKEEEYFKTGDLGYIDADQHLHVLGHKKEIIVFEDGSKVYLPEYEKEIEDVLRQECCVDRIHRKMVLILGKHTTDEEIVYLKIQKLMEKKPYNHRIVQIIHLYHPLPKTFTDKKDRLAIRKELHI